MVHDYVGHPFQVELSRELARRGHDVTHVHCPTHTTGRGAVDRLDDDSPTLDLRALHLRRWDKHSVTRRLTQEVRYGSLLRGLIAESRPDVVISANTPLVAQAMLLSSARRMGSGFVFWQQDIISLAAERMLAGRFWGSHLAVLPFRGLERRTLRRSDAVVAISSDFASVLREWEVDPARVSIIENWAPLPELPTMNQANPWSVEHNLAGARVLLYSGTLGMKHNPELLVGLARHFARDESVRVVVVSEGQVADEMRNAALREGLENLLVLPFQPYERLPEVLASAAVLVGILERDAGVFSVPSKILSYLCAGRPIIAAIPQENLASRTLMRANAGIVVEPDDAIALAAAAGHYLSDKEAATAAGTNARAFADSNFSIARIADCFESVIAAARDRARRSRRSGLG